MRKRRWFNTLSIFATLNLSGGVFNNGMLKYEDRRDAYTSAMQGLSLVATAIVFAVCLLLYPLFGAWLGLPLAVLAVMFLQILFTPPLSSWSTRQRFEYKYQKLVVVTLVMAVLNPVLALGMVLSAQDRGFARILADVLVAVLVGAFFMVYNIRKGKILFQKQYWKFALKFNLPLIPHYLSTMILGEADRIMIGNYYDDSKVAIYGLAYSLSLVMNIITASINSSFIPWTYQECRKGNYKRIGQVANVLLVFIGAMSLLPALLAPELMAILGPADYAEGVYLIAPICISVFITFIYTLFGNIEFYFEKSSLVMVASVSGAVLNVVLNAVCIPLFGYQAAAYTTLVCYIAFCVMHYVFMKKTCKEQGITERIYDVKKMIVLGVFLLLVAHGIMLTYPYFLLRIAIIAAMGLLAYKNRAKLMKELLALKQKD